MNWLYKCDMFSVKSVIFFIILSVACGCEGSKLYESNQNDEDDSMDCSDGRKIDDPILLPFLQKLRGQEILPAKMKEWVIYFSDKDVDEMFEGWNKSYLTEIGLNKDDQGVPYGRVYFTETTNVYLPRLTPVQDDWMEFRVMYAEQLLLDNIDTVKVYISYDSQGEKISKSSSRLIQVLLKRAHSQTVVVLSSSCNSSCIHDAANPLLTLETCGIVNGKNYTIKCEQPPAVFDDEAFNATEASHFDKITTPEFQVQLPAQLNQELQNILDWLLKRIGQRMSNYMDMAFKKNRFRKTNMELYNKVNLQISKIKGGKTFEAAKSADLIYNSLFDLNVYLNVTNTPYTFDKFHTFNLYLSYIGQFSKWQLDTTKYANFFEPLKELCLSQISIGNNLLKPATKIFELEEGVYDLNGVICHDNVLYIINSMPTINTIKSGLFDHSNCDFDTVFVLAKKNLTINEDLKIPGKNLIIFSPTWAIFKEHVIDLSGRNGRTDGETESGQSGGDFFGYGVRFDRSDFLKVISNGGDGSRGRNVTARVTDDRFTEEEGGKCIIKKGKEKDILAKYGATYGGSGGSAGTVTLKILRSPAQNYTNVRLDGSNGRDGKTGSIIFQCKSKTEVTFPANNLTSVNVISNDIQRMDETAIIELFRKVIRKNSRRLSYDVLNFYKDIWTSPIVGESLDSTLNDFLNSSDYTDSKDFYEITSQILHTQIKQTCNMTETQKIMLDFALATIRMSAPAENVLPSVIDVTSYLKEVSNSVGKEDVADEYFKMKEEKFRKIIEEANYYLKASLLLSLNRTMDKTHKYLMRNAHAYLMSNNLNEGRKYQQDLVSNTLLRYLTEILRHVQKSLEDFVKKDEYELSAGAPEEEHDSEKLEKKLYFFRYLRNNVTANEMNAMSEFIKLLKKTVDEDSSANGNKCTACSKELDYLVMAAKSNMQDSTEMCEKCNKIITQNGKRFVKRSVRLNERDIAGVDFDQLLSNSNGVYNTDFYNMDVARFWQNTENDNDRYLEDLESELFGRNNYGSQGRDFFDMDAPQFFTSKSSRFGTDFYNVDAPTFGQNWEYDNNRYLTRLAPELLGLNNNDPQGTDFFDKDTPQYFTGKSSRFGTDIYNMDTPQYFTSKSSRFGVDFSNLDASRFGTDRTIRSNRYLTRLESELLGPNSNGPQGINLYGQDTARYWFGKNSDVTPELASGWNWTAEERDGVCNHCPCEKCPFCPGCNERNFDEIDAGSFWPNRGNFDSSELPHPADKLAQEVQSVCELCPNCLGCGYGLDETMSEPGLPKNENLDEETLGICDSCPCDRCPFCPGCQNGNPDDTDAPQFLSSRSSRSGTDFYNIDAPRFEQNSGYDNNRYLTRLAPELLGLNNNDPQGTDFFDKDTPPYFTSKSSRFGVDFSYVDASRFGTDRTIRDNGYFTNLEAGLLWPDSIDRSTRHFTLRCKICPTCDGCPGYLDEMDAARFLSNSNGRHGKDYSNDNNGWFWVLVQNDDGRHHKGKAASRLSSSRDGRHGRKFDKVDSGYFRQKKHGRDEREFSLRCRSCPTCDGCRGELDGMYGPLSQLFAVNRDSSKMPELDSSENEHSDEIVGICDDCPCERCPFCPGCNKRNFDEIDAGLFWPHKSSDQLSTLTRSANEDPDDEVENICDDCPCDKCFFCPGCEKSVRQEEVKQPHQFDTNDAASFCDKFLKDIIEDMYETLNSNPQSIDISVCDNCTCEECPVCPKCINGSLEQMEASLSWPCTNPEKLKEIATIMNDYLDEINSSICDSCPCEKCSFCPGCNKRNTDETDSGPFRPTLLIRNILENARNKNERLNERTAGYCDECPCDKCPSCPGCNVRNVDSIDSGLFWPTKNINKLIHMVRSRNENAEDDIAGICDDCSCNKCPFCPGCKTRNFGEVDEKFLRHRSNFDALIEANSPSTGDKDIVHPGRSSLEKRSSVRSNKKHKKSSSPQNVSGMKRQNTRDSGCDGSNPRECLKLRSSSICGDCLSIIEDKRRTVAKLIAEAGEQCSAEGLKLCKSTVNMIKKIIPDSGYVAQDHGGSAIHLRCPDCNDTLEFFAEKLTAEINRCEQESNYNYREVESSCSNNEGIVFHMKGCDPETFSRTFDEIRENFLKEFSQFVAADEAHSNELDHVQTKFAYLLTNIDMLLQEGIPVSGASLNNILYVTDSLIKFKDLKMEYQKRMTELHDFSETDMYDLFSSSISMQNERLGVTSKWLGQLKKLMPWMKKVIHFLGADQKYQEVNERIREAIRLVSEIVHNVRLVERHRELRNYILRVRAIEKKGKTTGVGQAILDMKNIFQNTFMKDIFRKAVTMAQNWVFPLTKSYLAIQKIKNNTYQNHLAAVSEVVEEYKKSIMLYTTVHAFDSTKNDVPFYEWSVRTRPTLMHDLFSGKPVILVSEILDGGKKNSLMAKDFEVKFVAGRRQPPGTQEKIDEALKGNWLNLTHSGISYFKFGSRIYRRLTETFTFRHSASTIAREKTKSVVDYVLSPYTTWVLRMEPDSNGKYPQHIQDRIGSIELVGTGRFVINCADIPDVNQYFIPLNDYSRRNEK